MTLNLRKRILFTLFPLLALLAVLGTVAAVLLYQLSDRIDAILRENYDSVIYMERLKEALERIDSSFTFALAGRENKARRQYEAQWPPFLDNLSREQGNITLPGEQELVDQLATLAERYRKQGDRFFLRPAAASAADFALTATPDGPLLVAGSLAARSTYSDRQEDYFGADGLEATFRAIKATADRILRLNQENMEQASREARQSARQSLLGFGLGLAAATLLGVVSAWHTMRAILRPIQGVTQSARAIGAGNLDQIVPIMSSDELGQLAEAFNVMARQLRHYRQTDYSRLLRTQRTSQATIDSFPDPVLVVDPEGAVEMANPAAQRLFGVSGTRSDPSPTLPWLPPESLREPIRLALMNHVPYLPEEFDRAIPLRVGTQERSFLPRVLPIRDPYGATLGAAILLEDVTRFRLLDQVKNDLVATVSHELKTPLSSVRLALHLLLEETIGPLNPKQTELLLDARDNAERLLAMVNNLLDLAQLERRAGGLELRPEKPEALLRAAVEVAGPRAEDKGVTLEIAAAPDLPAVAVDATRLSSALGNLLNNAVTYTERGGKVILTASVADDQFRLTVADTGRGIAPEYLPHIFEKFFRIPGQSPESSTGLGLAIVHEIITAHGGTIICESQPGEGTLFRISLPIISPVAPNAKGETAP